MIYDISPLIDEETAVWPGDTRFAVTENLRLDDGETVNLSDIRLSCHTGAHADAPSHFADGAPSIDELALEPFIGPCTLLDVRPEDGIIRPSHLEPGPLQPRVLLRTREYGDRRKFPRRFTYLSVELVEAVAARGVRLVGLDSPSVDAFDSTELPAHHALYRHGIVNLECLRLAGPPAGDYELIALPLPLRGRDASPVRAILRDLDTHRRSV